MDKITIQNLEVFANHGVYPEENALGQKFIVSVIMYTDVRLAGQTDDLTSSVDYGEAAHFVCRYFSSHTFRLLESAAEHLTEELLLSFPQLSQVDLEVKKPWAPIALPLETVSVQISRKWHTAYIALGSNLGDKKGYLDMAVEHLNAHKLCRVKRVSDYLVTAPYGGVEQDDFLNGALCLETLLYPHELLDLIHQIEQEAHRERTVHWGPRTLDLDILLYDDLILDSPDLMIPHVEMHKRSFVLTPLAQIAPHLRHPLLHQTMTELEQALK